MKLFLSSFRFGSQPAQFAALFGANKKVAIIMNASDVYGPAKRPDYLKQETATLAQMGLQGEDFDLRDFFDNPEALEPRLKQYGGVWVMGGNTFTLRRAMKQSGFDKIAPPLITSNALVYGGFSAGAVVTAATLKGTDIADDPHQVPQGYDTEVIWEGLGLYSKSIAPHFRSEHPESPVTEKVVAFFEQQNMPYVALRDGEAIVVND